MARENNSWQPPSPVWLLFMLALFFAVALSSCVTIVKFQRVDVHQYPEEYEEEEAEQIYGPTKTKSYEKYRKHYNPYYRPDAVLYYGTKRDSVPR